MSEKTWKLSELKAMNAQEVYHLGRDELRIPGISSLGDDAVRRRVLAELSHLGRLIEDAGAPAAVAAATTVRPAAPEQPKPVRASYPPHSTEVAGGETLGVALIGETVAQAIAALRDAWSIASDGDIRTYVNGDLISPDRRAAVTLRAGDRLEITRSAGEKGGE